MPRKRVRKLVVEIRNYEGSYRLVAEEGHVRPEIMARIDEHITRLGPWVVRIGDEDWPLPELPEPAVAPPQVVWNGDTGTRA